MRSSPPVARTDFIAAALADLAARDRLRRVRVVTARSAAEVVVSGRELINFAANDYLGLGLDARLATAAAAAEIALGVGAGASRLVSGHTAITEELEGSLRSWLGVESVRLFNSGYAANTGLLPVIAEPGDLIVSDERNHASLIDGCRLSRATVAVYRHLDLDDLERRLRTPARRKVVVTESVFSMDGDAAPLAELVGLAHRHGALVVVDDAHAIGIMGESGRGLGVAAGADIVVGTLGKAVGAAGAFVAGPAGLAELLWNRARTLVFSTGLTTGTQAAAVEGVAILRGAEGDRRRQVLRDHRDRLGSRAAGLPGAIVPLVIGADADAVAASSRLEAQGFWIPAIRPPTVPEGTARLRITLSAAHTAEQVDRLRAALSEGLA
jgi:8-amino-7-oxononanoate synthase